jgi:peptide/nickel transport system substrate-binding protein
MSAVFEWKRIKRSLLLLLLPIVAIALSGCDIAQFRTQAAQVSQIVVTEGTDPKTFNYAINQSSPNVFGYIYEGLVTQNGATGEIEPAQAESWEISEDNLRIVFTLREGLKWSDGEPLTADDVIFTFNDIYLNEAIPAPVRDILRVGEAGTLPTVRKLDDRRVEFTVSEPFAPFLLYAGGANILPEHVLREAVETLDSEGNPIFLSTWDTGTDPSKVICNGAYQMVSYSPNQRIIMRRNPHYWRRDQQGNQLPYIERIVWQIVENTDAALMEFRSGGSDLISMSARTFMLLKREEDRGNFTIYNGGPALSTLFLTFNQNQGSRNGQPVVDPVKSRWFNTQAFRQAVAHAIDRPTMINNILLGLGEPLNSPIASQSPYFLSPEEGLPVYDYDPERAKQLLQGAGFTYNSAGQLFDAEGNRVQFTMLTNTGGRQIEAIGVQIKRDLAQIGIQADFLPIDFNTLLDRLRNTLQWDAYLGGITGGLEPHGQLTIWALDGGLHNFNYTPRPGGEPLEGQVYADWERRIAELYVRGAQVLDEAGRKAIYGEAQQLIQEQLPFIYLVAPLELAAVRDRIKGIQFTALGGPIWNLPELTVEEN